MAMSAAGAGISESYIQAQWRGRPAGRPYGKNTQTDPSGSPDGSGAIAIKTDNPSGVRSVFYLGTIYLLLLCHDVLIFKILIKSQTAVDHAVSADFHNSVGQGGDKLMVMG